MAEELSIDNEQLISLVEQQPVIWDRTEELYKNRLATQAAWEDIIVTMIPNIESKKVKTRQAYSKLIIQRWTHLRDNYNRSLRRLQDYKRDGGNKKPKPYYYDKQMKFLQKLEQYRLDDTASSGTEIKITESENQDNDSEEDIPSETYSLQSDDIMVTIPRPIPSRAIKRSLMDKEASPLPAKMMKLIDPYSNDGSINRHLSFFNGILPSLDNLDENDVLEFQIQVLQLLKRIRNSRLNS